MCAARPWGARKSVREGRRGEQSARMPLGALAGAERSKGSSKRGMREKRKRWREGGFAGRWGVRGLAITRGAVGW